MARVICHQELLWKLPPDIDKALIFSTGLSQRPGGSNEWNGLGCMNEEATVYLLMSLFFFTGPSNGSSSSS